MSTPFAAAVEIAHTDTIGVARTSEHGQAHTNTANARSTVSSKLSSENCQNARPAVAARSTIAGVYILANESIIFCVSVEVEHAWLTIRFSFARVESSAILVVLISK